MSKTKQSSSLAPEANGKTLEAAKRLLSIPKGNRGREALVQQRLAELLNVLGIEADPGHATGDGPVDLNLIRRRILIEVKDRGSPAVADPKRSGTGRRSGESAFEQTERYVRAMIERELEIKNLYKTEKESLRPWKGILTDGEVWHVWEWRARRGSVAEPAFDTGAHRTTTDVQQLIQLVQELTAESQIGKPHIPTDPTPVFQGCLEGLREVRNKRGKWNPQGFETKFQLWLDMLRTSGMAPENEAKQQELFLSHCLLVSIARGVIHTVSKPFEAPDASVLLKEGFTAWISETPEGESWAKDVVERVHAYEWRLERTDVMRQVYQAIVDAEDRKVFGEYYTPDWLAQLLAEGVLDSEWKERAAEEALLAVRQGRPLEGGVGVLDPACGSGTFLLHAAQLLLDSDAMKRDKSKQRKADAVCRLVNGIDIHPVAVELARATLLRTLPAPPTEEADALRVFQGDSLLASESDLFSPSPNSSELLIESPKGGQVYIPKTFASEPTFVPDMRDIVSAANAPEKSKSGKLPPHLAKGPYAKELEKALQAIRRIIAKERNSVWAWYITNITAPTLLAQRKVDRIVANPPWVRMSDIQEEKRKRTLERLAGKPVDKNGGCASSIDPLEHPPWNGGRNATGFDIAQLFVMRSRQKYLAHPDSDPAAWLVNSSAINGNNWDRFRDWHKGHLLQTLDFSTLKKQPFTGAPCAALLEHHQSPHTPKAKGKGRPKLLAKAKKPKNPVLREHELEEVLQRIKFSAPPPKIPRSLSGYVGKFRQGATIVPQPLVTIKVLKDDGKRAEVETKPPGPYGDRKYRNLSPQKGKVPSAWVAKAVFARDLLLFCIRPEPTTALIPVDKDGLLEKTPSLLEDFWRKLDQIYQQKSGIGGSTPETLIGNLNYQRKLSSQLPLAKPSGRETRRKVVYGRGKIMRASRVAESLAIEHVFYHWRADSEAEALYLVALLNAPALGAAFDAARDSPRDFGLTPWKRVPILKFDPKNEDHQALAKAARKAESLAEKLLSEIEHSDQEGQTSLSKRIREHLAGEGILDDIDRLARKLLPKQTRGSKGPAQTRRSQTSPTPQQG